MEEIKVSEMLQADSINKDDSVMIIQEGVNKKASGSIQTATGTSLSLTSVADTCKVKSNSVNLFDKDTAPTQNWIFDTANTKIIASANGKSTYIPCKPSTTYTISKVADVRFQVATTSTTPAIDVAYSDYIENNTASSITITTGASAKYLVIYYWHNSSTITEQAVLDTLQVEEGSTATSYNPYNTEVMISKSKNVFNQKQIVNPPANTQGTGIVLQLLPNTEYTMSSNCPMSHGNTTLIFFASGTLISGLSTSNNGVWDGQTRTFTSDSNGNMVVAYRRNTTDTDIDLTDYWYQIEQGSTATTYEEYSDEIQRLALTPSEEKSAFTYDTKTIILSDGNITIEYNTQSRLLNNDDALDIVEPVKEYIDRIAEEKSQEIYSTKETRIGTFMGKPLYRMMTPKISVNSNTMSSTSLVTLGIVDADIIIINVGKSISHYNTSVVGGAYNNPNYYSGSSDYGNIYIDANKVLHVSNMSGSTREYYVCLEYTKTTD